MTVRASIEVEERVCTGGPFPVAVVIETTVARIIRGVVLLLRGFSTLRASSEKDLHVHKAFGSWTVLLAETERLAPGGHRFEGSIPLPDDAPPSSTGVVEVYYELDARVKLEFPWMFEATATRRLVVARPAQRERRPPRPRTVSSVAKRSDALFVELSLDDTSFAPGELINGSFSLGNIGDKRVDAAIVSLVPLCPDVAGGGGNVSVFKSLAGVREGSTVHFSIPVPPTAALSFASRTLGVEQAIVLHVEGSSAQCRIPVAIDTFEPRSGELLPALPAGGARWRSTWGDEGARAGLALEDRELGLHGTLAGAVAVTVRPRGNGVRARLAWETLGIGLSILPRGLLPAGVSFGKVDPAFGQRFIARGHSPAQVLAALGPDLRAALLAFEEAKLDDTGAEIASSASARDPESLRRFLAALAALAAAVVAAERRIPPPAWVAPAVAEAWRAFAAVTAGRLCAGRMAVTGALVGGDLLDVETRCDTLGRAAVTRLTLSVDTLSIGPPAHRISRLPRSSDADLRRSVGDRDPAPQVEIRPHAVVLDLAGTTADPAALFGPTAEMAILARRLRGAVSYGPYR